MIPNFFIAGTPKAGTTSLFQYLNEHPQVFMCSVKEPNFFSYDEIDQQNLYYSEKGISNKKDYEALFKNISSEMAIGEASVSYLFYKNVPYKIQAAIPKAKFIILLRNPVDRAFSHYLMDLRLGYVDVSFEDIVQRRSAHPLSDLYYQQYVEIGLYYEQIKRFLSVFGPSQVKIFINEDLRADVTNVVSSVYGFLNVDRTFIPDFEKKYNVYQKPRNSIIKKIYSFNKIRQIGRLIVPANHIDNIKNTLLRKEAKPRLSNEIREYLKKLFAKDIKRTGNLIGRDLSPWYTNQGN